jgi:hypothetical protein
MRTDRRGRAGNVRAAKLDRQRASAHLHASQGYSHRAQVALERRTRGTRGVLLAAEGYTRDTRGVHDGVHDGVLEGYSMGYARGTQGVLEGCSQLPKGTRGVPEGRRQRRTASAVNCSTRCAEPRGRTVARPLTIDAPARGGGSTRGVYPGVATAAGDGTARTLREERHSERTTENKQRNNGLNCNDETKKQSS